MNGVQAEEVDRLRVAKRAPPDIEALIGDVDAGTVDRVESERRYVEIEQPEIDRDAAAGGIAQTIDGATGVPLPIAKPYANASRRLARASQDYESARRSLEGQCETFHWKHATESLDAWLPRELFPPPRRKATLGTMAPGHEEITIECFDASGVVLARATYPLQRMNHSWVFVPTPDDPVFAILTQPILEHAIAAAGEVTAPANTLVSELGAGGSSTA